MSGVPPVEQIRSIVTDGPTIRIESESGLFLVASGLIRTDIEITKGDVFGPRQLTITISTNEIEFGSLSRETEDAISFQPRTPGPNSIATGDNATPGAPTSIATGTDEYE